MKSIRSSSIRRAAAVTILASSLGACGIFGGDDPKSTPTIGDRTPVLSRIESGAKVDPALAGISVVLPPAQTNSAWPQAGGTASKSYGHLALAENPSRGWTAPMRSRR